MSRDYRIQECMPAESPACFSPLRSMGADFSYGFHWGLRGAVSIGSVVKKPVATLCLISLFVLLFASAVLVLASFSTTALGLSYGRVLASSSLRHRGRYTVLSSHRSTTSTTVLEWCVPPPWVFLCPTSLGRSRAGTDRHMQGPVSSEDLAFPS